MPIRSTPDPLAQRIGARIRDLRLAQGMSLDQFAAAGGTSKGHLSNVERGFVRSTIITLQSVARGLGIEIMDLVVFPELGERHALVDRTRGMSSTELKGLVARAERLERRREPSRRDGG